MPRQPVFSSISGVVNDTFDPSIADANYYPDGGNAPTVIFNGPGLLTGTGGIIHRITVSATADANSYPNVSEKLIFLYVRGDSGTGSGLTWNLYKTAAMPAATLSATVPNPSIVWEFDGGLAVTNSNRLGILASVNYITYNYYGDYLSYLVEYTNTDPIN